MNNIIKKRKGFTLVELVIVIVIVGILSVISVPIYRGYVEKAKMTEGKVLLNAIAKAELAYHVQYGEFYSTWDIVSWDTVLDINAEGNKYFKYEKNHLHPRGFCHVHRRGCPDYRLGESRNFVARTPRKGVRHPQPLSPYRHRRL